MAENWFPKIDSVDVARKAAKQGGLGGLILAGSYCVGLVLVYFANVSPTNKQPLSGEDVTNQLIGGALCIPIVLFLAWRTSTGRGWLSAGVMLLMFVVEVSLKVVSGTSNVGWMIAYVAVAAMMLNGIRACWWFRNNRPETAVLVTKSEGA